MSTGSFNAAAADKDAHERFFRAVKDGDAPAVAAVLAAQPDAVNWRQENTLVVGAGPDEFALHVAAKKGHLDIVRLLLAAGASLEAECYIKQTPLMQALDGRQPEVAAFLLQQGANPLHVASGGFTPLFIAARADDAASLGLLLEKGADINSRRDLGGETALFFAVATKAKEAIRALIRNGIDPAARNEDGRTAAQEAMLREDGQEMSGWISACVEEHAKETAARLEAEQEAQRRDINRCHTGTERSVAVGKPLSFRRPTA